ncbi:MAG: hypothetical protein Q8L07_04235 [Sediminibacterium sp.]|nr:hypothetical protein [Sediminibacterium sp.]
MNTIVSFVVDHKEAVGTAAGLVWELVVRLKPTWKDWSLVNAFKRLFDAIPNNSKTGGTH